MNSLRYNKDITSFAVWISQLGTLNIVKDPNTELDSIILPDGEIILTKTRYKEIYPQYAWMDCFNSDYLHRILTTQISDSLIIVGKAYTNPFKSKYELIDTIKLASELTWSEPDRFDFHAFNMWVMTCEVLTAIEKYAILSHLCVAR